MENNSGVKLSDGVRLKFKFKSIYAKNNSGHHADLPFP